MIEAVYVETEHDKGYIAFRDSRGIKVDFTLKEAQAICDRINRPNPIEVIKEMEKQDVAVNTGELELWWKGYAKGYEKALSELKRRLEGK